MLSTFNKAAHYVIGYWVASGINTNSYRSSCWLVAGVFLAYESLQAWKKGDNAYEEIREFGIGAAAYLVVKRVLDEWPAIDAKNQRL